ncbi:hypothetical protein HanPI659440_Chr09g0330261 [Helianthus annuus]|nr:hypothetical protein HanPI659440_Chr09g0330261 [Helianthus annuus]
MPNVFGDHNQHFIDISQEDDYLLSFHSLQDVRVSDNCASRRRSLLRKSLGWDSALITSEAGLLNPEELVKVNKGFKKLNPTTQKDAKISTKIAGAFKKMDICSRNKDTVTSHVKLFSSRQTNDNAAVGRSDNGVKVVNKTRKAKDFKMSSTCFTSPTVQKIVHRPYESPYTAKRSAKIVGCNSCKKINVCSQNKDTVTRLPKRQTNNNAAVVKTEKKTEKGLCTPSPTIGFFDSISKDNAHGDIQSEPRRQSLLRKSLAWDSAFFTSAGLLNPEELCMLNEGFKKSKPTSPKDAKTSKAATKNGGNQSNSLSCKKMNNAEAVKGSDNAKMENKTGTAQESKRSRSGGLSRLTCFTTPTIQKAINASRLRMPSPRIGFFDMEPGSVHDFFRFNERQLQSSNLSGVSAKAGKTGKKKWVNLSGPTRLRKMLSFDVELYD